MRLVTAGAVRRAVSDTLRLWLPYHLARAEEAEGVTVGAVDRPKEWRRPQVRGDAFLDLIPLLVVTVGGAEFERNAEDVDAAWEVFVTAYTHGASFDDTARDAGIYGAAIRSALDQHGGLGLGAGGDFQRGFAAETRVTSESYDAPEVRQRTLGEVVVGATVYVAAVHDLYGLTEPPADPTVEPSTPTVLTTDLTVQPEEDA